MSNGGVIKKNLDNALTDVKIQIRKEFRESINELRKSIVNNLVYENRVLRETVQNLEDRVIELERNSTSDHHYRRHYPRNNIEIAVKHLDNRILELEHSLFDAKIDDESVVSDDDAGYATSTNGSNVASDDITTAVGSIESIDSNLNLITGNIIDLPKYDLKLPANKARHKDSVTSSVEDHDFSIVIESDKSLESVDFDSQLITTKLDLQPYIRHSEKMIATMPEKKEVKTTANDKPADMKGTMIIHNNNNNDNDLRCLYYRNLAYNCRILKRRTLISDIKIINGKLRIKTMDNKWSKICDVADLRRMFPNFKDFVFY